MEIRELRIGNLVRINNPIHRKKDTDKTFHILKIDSENDSCNGVCIDDIPYAECFGQFLKYIEPIPLTEEWLIKFGAIVRHNEYYNYDKFEIKRKDLKYSYFVEKTSNEYFNISITQTFCENIKYVHQLQNLYFALTGDELQVNVA